MATLKRRSDGVAPAGRLKTLLHGRLAGMREARSLDTLHASLVTAQGGSFCPRQVALMRTLNVEGAPSFLSTAMSSTFAMGHAMQDLVTTWVRDLVYGVWRCPVCGGARRGIIPRTEFGERRCADCGSTLPRMHEELRVTSTDTGISCGLDLLLRDAKGSGLTLYEIKIMDKDEFRALRAPLAEHRLRTSLYLRCLEESGDATLVERVHLDRAEVLYFGRCFGLKDDSVAMMPTPDSKLSPFRQYTVRRDDTLTETPCARARAATAHAREGLMPAGICRAPTDKLAMRCPVAGACFGPDHPSAITWHENGHPRHPKLPSSG